jgi:hypothetical protein
MNKFEQLIRVSESLLKAILDLGWESDQRLGESITSLIGKDIDLVALAPDWDR